MAKKPTKWDINSARKYVENNSNCTLLSEDYTRLTDKMLFRCECGNEFETSLDTFKSTVYKSCKICANKFRGNKQRIKNQNNFIKYLKNIRHDEYILLSSYKTNKDKVMLYHRKCGNI